MYFDTNAKQWKEGAEPQVTTKPVYGSEGLKGSQTITEYPSGKREVTTYPKEVVTPQGSSYYPNNVVTTTTFTPVSQSVQTTSQVQPFQQMVDTPFASQFAKVTTFTPITSTINPGLTGKIQEEKDILSARVSEQQATHFTQPLTMDIQYKDEYLGKTVSSITPEMIGSISFKSPYSTLANKMTPTEQMQVGFMTGAVIAAGSSVIIPALATYGTAGVIASFVTQAGLAGTTGLWLGGKGKEYMETGAIKMSDFESSLIVGGIYGGFIGMGLAQPKITLKAVNIFKKQYVATQDFEFGGNIMKSEGYFPEKMTVTSGETLEIGMGKATYKIDIPLGKSSWAVTDIGYVSSLTKSPLISLESFQKFSPTETTQFFSSAEGNIMWQGKMRPIFSESYGLSFPTTKEDVSFSEARGISGMATEKKGYWKVDIWEFSEEMLTAKTGEKIYPSGVKRESFIGIGGTDQMKAVSKMITFDITKTGEDKGFSFISGTNTAMKPFTAISTDTLTKGMTESLTKITTPKPSAAIIPMTNIKMTSSPTLETKDLGKQISSQSYIQKSKSEYYTLLKPFPQEQTTKMTQSSITGTLNIQGSSSDISSKLIQIQPSKSIQTPKTDTSLSLITPTTTTTTQRPSISIPNIGGGGFNFPQISFPKGSFGSSFKLKMPRSKQSKKYRPSLGGLWSGLRMPKSSGFSIGIEPRYPMYERKRHRKKRR